MAPGDLLKFEQPPRPIDRVVNEVAIVLAERKFLGMEPPKKSFETANNDRENQELIHQTKRDREREIKKIEIMAEAEKIKTGLKHFIALVDSRDAKNIRKETGFTNMILSAEDPVDALLHAYEIERKHRLEKIGKEEQAA